MLRPHGFVLAVDELPTRFVLRNEDDQRIDFHTVTFDTDGSGVQQLQNGTTFRYTPEGFSATGQVAGQAVRCLSPEVQMLCHTGYEHDANDEHDVRLLHTRFGLDLPQQYQH